MIKCIVLDFNKVEEELQTVLTQIIHQNYATAQIDLKSQEIYWKCTDSKMCIYHVSDIFDLLIANIMKLFAVSWNHYITFQVRDKNTSRLYMREEAIWSKNIYRNEIFLLPETQWVHIYTWLE